MVSAAADGRMDVEEPCDDDENMSMSKSGKKGKQHKSGKSKGGKGVGKGSKSSKYPDGGKPSLYVMTNSVHGNAVQMYCR